MKTRSVRLDDETEELLHHILQKTDLSITEAFKEGIRALARSIDEQSSPSPYEVFMSLDLGPGGEPRCSASQAKQEVANIIAGKHKHDSR
jgi:hypothetical protein